MSRYKETRSYLLSNVSAYLSIALLTSACAIHPLPENVTGLDIGVIVRKLRCEIRDSIKEQAVYLLDNDDVADRRFKDDAIRIIEEDFPAWRTIDRGKLSERSRILINRYDDALIFMDFTFQISEDNNNGTEINLLSTLVRGTDALNIKATNNRTRKNTVNFRVQDSFVGIFNAELTCAGRSKNPDYMYPITGRIGISKVVDTFLQLNETRALSPGLQKDRLYASTLSFTTTVSAGLGPKITLSPLDKPFRLADASFTSSSTRTDVHEVLIGLSLPEEEVKFAKKEITSGSNITRRTTTVVTKQPRQEQAAQLNEFMNFQLQRNLILNAPINVRPFAISIF